MGEFKFEEAVTQAFRTSDGKQFGWRLIFWTAAALSVVSLIIWPMILPHYGDLMTINQQNMQSIMGGTPSQIDEKAMNALFLKMAPSYLLLMAGYWLVWVSSEAALHRKVLLNKEWPKRPLRLGKDELRVWLAQLGVFAIIFAIYFFGLLGVFLFAAVLGGGIGVAIIIFGIIGILCVLLTASIRLAPAAALSIRNDKTYVIAAKKITKGRFWTLFPPFFVVFFGGYILLYLVMTIGVGLVTGDASFLMTMSGLGENNPQEAMAAAAERLKNPLVMLVGILSLIAYCAVYAIWMITIMGVSSHAIKVWVK